MLMKVLSCIRYLARQGLPFHGHNEDAQSFEGKLLLLEARDNADMRAWLRQREYISPEIFSEIISTMGQSLLRQLLVQVRSSLWFSILADKATDVALHEQMSLSIRCMG